MFYIHRELWNTVIQDLSGLNRFVSKRQSKIIDEKNTSFLIEEKVVIKYHTKHQNAENSSERNLFCSY